MGEATRQFLALRFCRCHQRGSGPKNPARTLPTDEGGRTLSGKREVKMEIPVYK